MPPLNRAFALTEHFDVSMMICNHLEFDMPRCRDELLDIHISVRERSRCFGLRLNETRFEFRFAVDDAHAATAASGSRFHDYRITDLARDLESLFRSSDYALRSRKDWNAGFLHQRASPLLKAH